MTCLVEAGTLEGPRAPREGLRRAKPGFVRAIFALAAASGCAAITARPVDGAEPPAHPAGVLQMVWRTTLHEHGLFEPVPEECATGALANGHLVIGSRASSVVGVAPDTGHIDWVKGVTGGVDSTARFDRAHGQVYVGADDGTFYAFDPASGTIRWTYHGKGAFERAPELERRPGLRGQRHRSRGRARSSNREVALAVRARDAGGVHHPRLRGPAPARQRAAGRFRRRLLRVAGRRQRRGALGALAGHRLRAVRRRRHDARAAGQSRLRGLLLGRPLRHRSARRRHQVAPARRGGRRRQRRRRASLLRGAPAGAARRRSRRPRHLAPGADRGRRSDPTDGRRALPDLLGQPRRSLHRRSSDGRAPRAVQSGPRRLRRPDPRRQAPAPLRPLQQRLPLRPRLVVVVSRGASRSARPWSPPAPARSACPATLPRLRLRRSVRAEPRLAVERGGGRGSPCREPAGRSVVRGRGFLLASGRGHPCHLRPRRKSRAKRARRSGRGRPGLRCGGRAL